MDQDSNDLDAKHEACAAYVSSQRQGFKLVLGGSSQHRAPQSQLLFLLREAAEGQEAHRLTQETPLKTCVFLPFAVASRVLLSEVAS